MILRLVDMQSKRVAFLPGGKSIIPASLVGILHEPKPLQLDPKTFETLEPLYGMRADQGAYGTEVYAEDEGNYRLAVLLPPKE